MYSFIRNTSEIIHAVGKNGSRETSKAVIIFCSFLLLPRTICLNFDVYYNNGKLMFYTKQLSQLIILFNTLNTMVNLGLRICTVTHNLYIIYPWVSLSSYVPSFLIQCISCWMIYRKGKKRISSEFSSYF